MESASITCASFASQNPGFPMILASAASPPCLYPRFPRPQSRVGSRYGPRCCRRQPPRAAREGAVASHLSWHSSSEKPQRTCETSTDTRARVSEERVVKVRTKLRTIRTTRSVVVVTMWGGFVPMVTRQMVELGLLWCWFWDSYFGFYVVSSRV